MSQGIPSNINPNTTSGTQLANVLNLFKDAIVSGFSGTSRPSNLQAGGYWVDTTGTPNYWQVKIYTGSTDIVFITVDLATGTASVSSAGALLEIMKSINDDSGGILKFFKERPTAIQALTDDSLGMIQWKGNRDDDVEALQAQLQVFSADDVTATAQGAYLVFSMANVGTAALQEVYRIVNGNFGLGTQAPTEKFHVLGNIKTERSSDDAVGTTVVRKKRRASGGGQVLSGDTISTDSHISMDNTGTETEVAKVTVAATQTHTTAAQGTSWTLATKKTGSATFTDRIIVDGTDVNIPDLKIGTVSSTELSYLDGVTSNIQTQFTGKQSTSEKGQINGYAELDGTGKVPAAQLPSYVDDVIEVANYAALPVTGATGVIYVTLDTNKVYRWTGSVYVEVSQSLADAFVFTNAFRLGTDRHLETQAATDSTTTGSNALLTAFTAGIVRLTNVSLTSIAGIPAGSDGQILIVINRTGVDQNIVDSVDAVGTAGNRIVTGTGAGVTFANNAAFIFCYDSTTARWQIVGGTGSGSGGVGGINYITNYNAEKNTTGWATYKDTAGTAPFDGTGGSPTLTFTRSLTAPLRGIASFLITKTASNLQGEGASYDFTIDSADTAKVLQGSFDYSIASGTYADNDLSVWIYDITNNALIQPAPYLIKNSTTVERFGFEFQSSLSTSYRLIIHCSSTSASAYTVKMDNVQVGPSAKLYGSMASDEIAFVASSTGIPIAGTPLFFLSRNADKLKVRGFFTTGSISGQGSLTLPWNLKLDAAKLTSNNTTSNPGEVVGKWTQNAFADAGIFHAIVAPATDLTKIYVGYPTTVGGGAQPYMVPSSGVLNSSAVTYVEFEVPILGWGSSQAISSDADTRVVLASYAVTTGVSTTGNTPVNFETKLSDTHNAVTVGVGNWRFTAPVPGFYRIYGSWSCGASDNIKLWLNGSAVQFLSTLDAAGYTAPFSTSIPLKAGDYIDVRIANTETLTSGTVGTYKNVINIEKSSGPSQIMASETITASYWLSANFAASSTTPINFDSKEFDSHGAVTTSPTAWKFTAPISGTYDLKTLGSVSSSSYLVSVFKGGTVYKKIGWGDNTYRTSSTRIKLLAGEYIDVRPDAGATFLGGTLSTTATHISIERTGNY